MNYDLNDCSKLFLSDCLDFKAMFNNLSNVYFFFTGMCFQALLISVQSDKIILGPPYLSLNYW